MRKDLYYIRQLLGLYYGGMSTRKQERELTDFFASTPEAELPADIRADRRVLLCRIPAPVPKVPEDLGSQLSARIDMLDRKERRARRGRRLMAWVSIAASLAIVVTAAVFMIKDSSVSAYELTDPKEAQAETQRALLLVSECLNKADRKAEETDLLLERLGFDMSLFEDDYMEECDSLMTDAVVPGEFSDTTGV